MAIRMTMGMMGKLERLRWGGGGDDLGFCGVWWFDRINCGRRDLENTPLT